MGVSSCTTSGHERSIGLPVAVTLDRQVEREHVFQGVPVQPQVDGFGAIAWSNMQNSLPFWLLLSRMSAASKAGWAYVSTTGLEKNQMQDANHASFARLNQPHGNEELGGCGNSTHHILQICVKSSSTQGTAAFRVGQKVPTYALEGFGLPFGNEPKSSKTRPSASQLLVFLQLIAWLRRAGQGRQNELTYRLQLKNLTSNYPECGCVPA